MKGLLCDGCGKAIKDNGWRAYPAVVDGDHLAGTKDGAPIGPGVDLHTGCAPKSHPSEVKDADGSD